MALVDNSNQETVVKQKYPKQNPSSEISSSDSEGLVETPVQVWPGQPEAGSLDSVASEIAVAMVYNGVSHAVMMASPTDLEVFALGFSFTEGIIERMDDIYEISTNKLDQGIEVSLQISSPCFARLKEKRRSLTGRTGCGICGAESLQNIRLPTSSLSSEFTVSHGAIDKATRNLNEHQPLQDLTGAVHAACWCSLEGELVELYEDVGRHNALDKLIGSLWQQDRLGEQGFLLISSRASYEIIQKSVLASIGIIVAISAPTSFAIEIANEANVTLVGFSREGRHVAYSNLDRLVA